MEKIARQKMFGLKMMSSAVFQALAMCLLIFESVSAESVNVISAHTPLCMDVAYANQKNGAVLGTWPCHSGANQKFELKRNGEIRVYGNKCVDALGAKGNRGDRIGIWDCNGGANQKWVVTGNGEIKGINNRCIDIKSGWRVPGGELILWDCNGQTNQKWQSIQFQKTVPAQNANIIPANQQQDLVLKMQRANGKASFTMPIGNNLANVTPLTQVTP